MKPRSGHRPRQALELASLNELALSYVGRFATSRAKLTTYLERKLRERGWVGETEPDLAAIADRLAQLGYVDDAAFAIAKARSLTGRGLGGRRVGEALYAAGIDEEDGNEALAFAHDGRVEAALRMARRRRFGPFAVAELDPIQREKAIGAMLRAGHGYALSKAIVELPSGHRIDHSYLEELR